MINNTLQNALILLFAGVACFLGYYIYSNGMLPAIDSTPDSPGSFMRTEAEFREKLTSLNMKKNRVISSVKKLNTIKKEVVSDLRTKGINSGADFAKADDKVIKSQVLDLKKTIQEIKKGESTITKYETAIDNIRSMLAKFERERVSASAALTEEQAIELEEIILDLDNKLEVKTDLFEDQELENLLDLEMVE